MSSLNKAAFCSTPVYTRGSYRDRVTKELFTFKFQYTQDLNKVLFTQDEEVFEV